jgi:hypothetical protein
VQLQQEAQVAQAQAVLKKPVPLRQLVGSVCQALQVAYDDPDVIRWLPG